MSRLESLVFLWPRRVYGGSCKTFPFRRFSSRLSCPFAWTAWRFVTFQPVSKVVVCGRRNTFASCSQNELQFSWPAQHFGRVQRHFAWQALRSTLRTPHSTLHTPPFTLHTPPFTIHTLHSTLYTLHSTLPTLHSTLYTLHSTL